MIGIKNMELPKSCAECGFVVDDMCGDATCILLCDEWKDNENHRAENCPLTEIITCKDCKHWHDDGIMTTCDKNIGHGFPKDHFCGDGERRE